MKAEKKIYSSICMTFMIVVMTLAGLPCPADADNAAGMTLEAYNRGIIP